MNIQKIRSASRAVDLLVAVGSLAYAAHAASLLWAVFGVLGLVAYHYRLSEKLQNWVVSKIVPKQRVSK